MSDNNISVVIRVHSLKCLPLLDRALFGLVGQESILVQAIVVCQGLNPPQFDSVYSFANKFKYGSIDDIQVINVPNDRNRDIRSKLLNEGIKTGARKYLAFLDYDDIVYPSAYSTLIDTLSNSEAAIAFGKIISCWFSMVGPVPYIGSKTADFNGSDVYDLFVDNFCPLHSYVIDTSKIDKRELSFNEEYTALEDYEFLLRVCSKYPSDFSNIDTIVGEYYRRETDTIALAARKRYRPEQNMTLIEHARNCISQVKRELKYSTPVSEFAWISKKYEREVIVTKEVENDRIIENVFGHTKQVANILVASIQENVRLGNGFIDTVGISEVVEISGWIFDERIHSGDLKLICITSNGQLKTEPNWFDRVDVREKYDTDIYTHGFKFVLDEIGMDSNNITRGIEVIAVNEDGVMIYKLPYTRELLK